MKFELNEVKFNSTEWNAEELGTLREGLDKGDSIKFAKIKADKQVTILITEKGNDAPNKQVVTSKNVSAMVKSAISKGVKKVAVLKALLSLNVIKNDTGYFLVAPQGEIGESFTLAEIDKAETFEFSAEETIA